MQGRTAALTGLLLGSLLLTSCRLADFDRGPAPTPTPLSQSSAQQARPTTQVRRGAIVEAIKVLGRVVAAEEADLSFTLNGRLQRVYVEPGDQVAAGRVLAELEMGNLSSRIGRARVLYEQAQEQLEKAISRVVIEDTVAQRQAVDQAELSLALARLALAQLEAGPDETALRDAEYQLMSAQVSLGRARSDLAMKRADLALRRTELQTKLAGPTDLDLVNGRAALVAATVNLARQRAGPRPEDVRAAQIALDRARLDLAQLLDAPGADPQVIAAAQAQVEKARVDLDKAAAEQRRKPSAATEVALKAAQLALQRYENELRKLLNARPSPWEVRQKELAVEAAETALTKLRAPDPYALRQAEVAAEQAQARLDALLAGPTEQELAALRTQIETLEIAVAAAEQALPALQATVAAKQAQYDRLLQEPTSFQLIEQEQKVATQRVALDAARERLALRERSLAQARASLSFDVERVRQTAEQRRLDLEWLEAQDGAAKLVAPFDGRVTRVASNVGDWIPAYLPVVSVADTTQLIVKADVPEEVTPKLSLGQPVELTLEAYPERVLAGTLESLPEAVVTDTGVIPDGATKVRVAWPGPGAELGMLAHVHIIVERRDGVLLVPSTAVKTFGKRRFVEYMDGRIKRSRTVQVGITTDTEVEVVAGLNEGMTVLAGP